MTPLDQKPGIAVEDRLREKFKKSREQRTEATRRAFSDWESSTTPQLFIATVKDDSTPPPSHRPRRVADLRKYAIGAGIALALVSAGANPDVALKFIRLILGAP